MPLALSAVRDEIGEIGQDGVADHLDVRRAILKVAGVGAVPDLMGTVRCQP